MDEIEQMQVVDRRLGRAERFFWLFDQASTMSFSFYALLEGELNIENLQLALNRLRQEQAMLRVQVRVDGNKACFKAVSAETIPVQVLKTDVEQWREKILDQVAIPFAADAYPLIKCFYMPMKGRSLVFLICHHAIIDGLSVSGLMQRLLKLATNPVLLNEPIEKRANPRALDELLPTDYQGVKGRLRSLVHRSSEMREWYRYGSPKHVSVFEQSAKGRCQPKCVFFKISVTETSALLAACKAKGFSLQSVLIVAQLYSLNSLENKAHWEPMAISSAVDLRTQLIETIPADEVGLYISFILTALKFQENDDFWGIVEKAHVQLKSNLSRDAALAFWQNLPPEFLFGQTDKGAKRLLSISGILSPASSIISNLGPISYDGLSNAKVLESSFNLCPSTLTSLCTAVTTVNDELSIGLNYDGQKMKDKNVAVIADIMRILLLQAINT